MRLQPKATVIQKCLAPTTDAQLSKSGLNLVDLTWELCALRATSHFLTAARKRREPCGAAGWRDTPTSYRRSSDGPRPPAGGTCRSAQIRRHRRPGNTGAGDALAA